MTLEGVYGAAQARGYLGAGSLESHLEHAYALASVIAAGGADPQRAVDLGSGGGVPGLALALHWPSSRWTLVESRAGRCALLRQAVATLGLVDRVSVLHGRAEQVGRLSTLRGRADLVTSRAFGPPAVTAECGAPFLQVGGRLVVSEPPTEDPGRWPPEALAMLGLTLGDRHTQKQATAQILVQVAACPDRFARRPGVPQRRPLW